MFPLFAKCGLLNYLLFLFFKCFFLDIFTWIAAHWLKISIRLIITIVYRTYLHFKLIYVYVNIQLKPLQTTPPFYSPIVITDMYGHYHKIKHSRKNKGVSGFVFVLFLAICFVSFFFSNIYRSVLYCNISWLYSIVTHCIVICIVLWGPWQHQPYYLPWQSLRITQVFLQDNFFLYRLHLYFTKLGLIHFLTPFNCNLGIVVTVVNVLTVCRGITKLIAQLGFHFNLSQIDNALLMAGVV